MLKEENPQLLWTTPDSMGTQAIVSKKTIFSVYIQLINKIKSYLTKVAILN